MVASEQFDGIIVCERNLLTIFQPQLSSYTIVLREGASSVDSTVLGELVFGQETQIVQVRPVTGNFLPPVPGIPPLLESAPLAVRVIDPGGDGVSGVGVLLRTRYRVEASGLERCPNDFEPALAGLCYSDPIAFAVTDADGRVTFDRPPGAYGVEVFADCLSFRPVFQQLETPVNNVTSVAEPAPCPP